MGPDDTFNPTNFTDYTIEVYDTFTAFPEQGEPGRFYVDASDGHTYIWSNDLYAVIPNSFLHSVDSMPRYHTRLSVPNMADIEFAPLNLETPTMTAANGFDTDGDIAPSQLYAGTGANTGPINIVQDGTVDATEIAQSTSIFASIRRSSFNAFEGIQTIRIGNLDTGNPETFYDFLKMWPLYNNNGQVIGLFDTKEHRDQAKERLEKIATQGSKETVLQKVFKNVNRKTPVDDVS